MADNWLKAAHLMRDQTYQKFKLTIKDVDDIGHGRKYENKQPIDGFILRFEKTDKEFVIKEGSTNHKLIRAQLGPDPSYWIGERLELFPVMGNWFHESNLLAVRIFVDDDKPRPKIAKKDMGQPIIGLKVGSRSEKQMEDGEVTEVAHG